MAHHITPFGDSLVTGTVSGYTATILPPPQAEHLCTVEHHLSELVGSGGCSDDLKVRITETMSNIVQDIPTKVLFCSLWTLVSVSKSDKSTSFHLVARLVLYRYS